MATLAQNSGRTAVGDEGFFMGGALAMALVLVAGFSLQAAMGRSSFGAPLPVHVHAFAFFGWTALYVAQNALVATRRVDLHRRLGKLAAIWIPALIVIGLYMSVRAVRTATVPFFFEPSYFLFMSSLSLLSFVGLTAWAVALRYRTEWHRRLMFCGMASITGPGWGRLLPMPLLIPYAGWIAFFATLLFPLAGIVADLRRSGRVHPAWWWGLGVMVATQIIIVAFASSAPGIAIYDAVAEGSKGAALDPTAYPPMPVG